MKSRSPAAVLLIACLSLPAIADWQPARAVKIVVPFAPGGQPDVVARALSEPLARALGKPVVIENRPGAGGNIAADLVAKSAPDGCTLLLGTNGPLAVSPALARNLPYDVERDFSFVTLVGTSPNLIAVHPSLGAATLAEVVAKAKSEAGKLNFASVGKGSVSQLSMEQLNAAAGIVTAHIPYNGGAAAVTALLGGDVQLLSLNPTALIAHVQAKRIRVVAQTGQRRSPLLPDVPTVAESGYPGFEASVWMVFAVPSGTPPAAVARLHAELARIIRSPAMKASLWDGQWIDPLGSTPEEAARIVRAETAKWAGVGRRLGLALD
jgi:tripartite-type tricarboxylate transporter receptor subunit TctC